MRPDYFTTTQAAEKANVTVATMIHWCQELGIGVKVGGRWRVDPKQLEKVLDGTLDKEFKTREIDWSKED